MSWRRTGVGPHCAPMLKTNSHTMPAWLQFVMDQVKNRTAAMETRVDEFSLYTAISVCSGRHVHSRVVCVWGQHVHYSDSWAKEANSRQKKSVINTSLQNVPLMFTGSDDCRIHTPACLISYKNHSMPSAVLTETPALPKSSATCAAARTPTATENKLTAVEEREQAKLSNVMTGCWCSYLCAATSHSRARFKMRWQATTASIKSSGRRYICAKNEWVQ